jgi:hypothetical protein
MNVFRVLRLTLAVALVTGAMTVARPAVAEGANVTATLVATRSTSTWTKPSPDPSGITFANGSLIISDGEVDEMPLYQNVNVFYSSLTGQQSSAQVAMGWTTKPASSEPTGISYTGSRILTSDDDKDMIFIFNTGSDGRWVSGQDPAPASFSTATADGDAEDLTVDMDLTANGHIVVIDGVDKDVYEYGPMNGTYGLVSRFDVGQYGALDPEGIEYHAGRDTLLVLDSGSKRVYEVSRRGALLNVINISAAPVVQAAGITLAPASNGSGGQNMYIVDRGVDNNTNPNENDGRFYEMTVPLPPLSGGDITPPTVTATSPTDGATGVAVGANITATFNEAVQGVSGTTFTLTNTATGAAVSATVSYNATYRRAVLNPGANLAAGRQYTATLAAGTSTSGIRDLANNPFGGLSWSFTTAASSGDTVAPTLRSHTPAANATGVARGVNVTATFSERVKNVTATTFYLTGPSGRVAAVLSNPNGGTKWVLNPDVRLAANTTYTATVVGGTGGVTDLAGNPLATTQTWSFRTGA